MAWYRRLPCRAALAPRVGLVSELALVAASPAGASESLSTPWVPVTQHTMEQVACAEACLPLLLPRRITHAPPYCSESIDTDSPSSRPSSGLAAATFADPVFLSSQRLPPPPRLPERPPPEPPDPPQLQPPPLWPPGVRWLGAPPPPAVFACRSRRTCSRLSSRASILACSAVSARSAAALASS